MSSQTHQSQYAGPRAQMNEQFEPYHAEDLQPWETNYAMWIHLGALIAYVAAVIPSLGVAFPVPLIAALVLWLVHKHDSEFLDDHGREAVNFQISMCIFYMIAWVVGAMMFCVGYYITLPLVSIFGIVGCAMGAYAGKQGQIYRYPATIRFL
ncbi:MAG: DUF4870 domain-containing protein [Phycisphaeraceae bacterium]|nr:DUF4870 domain-containing protein [Phycisphaerales bacterium]MCB9860024.1 DUF4870 domain-containing protein [Phycisphaeraceae bacterium]